MKRSEFFTYATLGALVSGFARTFGFGVQDQEKTGSKNGGGAPSKVESSVEESSAWDSLIYPQALVPGDTIAVVATAGIVSDEGTLEQMKRELETLGLKVRFGESVKARHGYFSGTDAERAEDVHRMFLDPEVKAILAVRGGWGSARLIPLLDFDLIRKNAKIFCGFSDNTTLHLAFLKHAGMVSFHGPNGNAEWSDLTRDSFQKVLFEGGGRVGGSRTNGRRVELRSDGITTVLRGGVAFGPLIGGNLSILTSAIGTSYQPETKGSILFAEDIGEPPYKIDRMLTQWKLAGLLDEIAGFVFGTCLNCKESESAFSLRDVLEHHLLPLGVPAVMGFDIGHHERNITLPVGWLVELRPEMGRISAWLPE